MTHDVNTSKTAPTMKTDTATPVAENKSAKDKAKDTASAAQDRGKTLAKEAKTQAATMTEDAKSAVHQRADAAKTHAADEADNAAEAFYDAADKMDDGSIQERLMGQIADGISGATDQLRSKDMSTAIDDLTMLARKHPVAFLGGAALLGFAATRFVKATDRSCGRDHDGGFA